MDTQENKGVSTAALAFTALLIVVLGFLWVQLRSPAGSEEADSAITTATQTQNSATTTATTTSSREEGGESAAEDEQTGDNANSDSAQDNTATEDEWRTYEHEGLDLSVSFPQGYEVNENSRPGEFTIRLEKTLPSGNEARVDFLYHKDEIDIGLEEVFKVTWKGREAYEQTGFNGCARTSQTACVMNSLKVPLEGGERFERDGGTIWEVLVAEIHYGVFRELSNETLAAQGVNVNSSSAINAYFGLQDAYEQEQETLARIVESAAVGNLPGF